MRPVTGLANRYPLMDRLGQAMLRLSAARQVALVFIDVDHLRSTTPTGTGRRRADGTARRLSAVGRREDTVARLGGDGS